MNDEDLRDLFAAFALISRAWCPPNLTDHASQCYQIADAMIEAKYAEKETGIKAVKPKRKKVGDE